jgi:hypothetical protein
MAYFDAIAGDSQFSPKRFHFRMNELNFRTQFGFFLTDHRYGR